MLRLLVALLPALLMAARLVAATGGFCPPGNAGFCKPRGGLFIGTEIRCDITEGLIEFYAPGCDAFSHFIPNPAHRGTYPCRAYAGMNVSVRCGSSSYIEEGGRELFVDGERASVGDDGVFLITNVSVGDETLLECRNVSGFVTASRNLSVIGDVRVAGVSTDNCDIFYCDADYQCCRGSREAMISYSTDFENVAPIKHFVVVGESPSLSWDVVWLNHYPVPLELEITDDPYYNNSRTKVLHLRNGWPERISAVPRALIRVTASNGYSNHTTCFGVWFETNYQTITVNSSLLRNTTVAANSDAVFQSELGYANADRYAYHHIHLSLFPSPLSSLSHSSCTCTLGEDCICESCNFTVSFLSPTNTLAYRSYLYSMIIASVSLNDTGTIVSFSYLTGNGGLDVQWQGNATLTVVEDKATPTVVETTSTEAQDPSTSAPFKLVPIAVPLAVVTIAAAIVSSLGVWLYRWRKRQLALRCPHMEFVPLTASSSISSLSDATSPCASSLQLPAIQISHMQDQQLPLPLGQARAHSHSNRHRNGDSHSLDSGVDEDDYPLMEWHPPHPPRTLHLPHPSTASHKRSHNHSFFSGDLTRTQSEPTVNKVVEDELEYALRLQRFRKYRIYISYTESKAMWVMEKLKPLIERLQVTEVTLHDFDMIPGKTIPEERLRLILDADKIVIVCSSDYGESEWCDYELQHAIMKEPRLCRGKVIPILTDGCETLPKIIEGIVPLPDTDYNFIERLATAICPTPLQQ